MRGKEKHLGPERLETGGRVGAAPPDECGHLMSQAGQLPGASRPGLTWAAARVLSLPVLSAYTGPNRENS